MKRSLGRLYNTTNDQMEYFKSGSQLISRIEESNTYTVKNNIGVKVRTYTKEQFDAMPKKKMHKTQFNEELNSYFKNYKETWEWEGEKFRAMENFELNSKDEITNYIVDSIPTWNRMINGVLSKLMFIYNKGKVFYLNLTSLHKGIATLIDATTFEELSYVRLKNCCPVMNLTKRSIR